MVFRLVGHHQLENIAFAEKTKGNFPVFGFFFAKLHMTLQDEKNILKGFAFLKKRFAGPKNLVGAMLLYPLEFNRRKSAENLEIGGIGDNRQCGPFKTRIGFGQWFHETASE